MALVEQSRSKPIFSADGRPFIDIDQTSDRVTVTCDLFPVPFGRKNLIVSESSRRHVRQVTHALADEVIKFVGYAGDIYANRKISPTTPLGKFIVETYPIAKDETLKADQKRKRILGRMRVRTQTTSTS